MPKANPATASCFSLGNAEIPAAERSLIAQAVEGHFYGQKELLPPDDRDLLGADN